MYVGFVVIVPYIIHDVGVHRCDRYNITFIVMVTVCRLTGSVIMYRVSCHGCGGMAILSWPSFIVK